MNKEELLALGLSEEQSDKVYEKYKNMIPYSRFKEAIDEKNELKTQLSSRDEQLKELAKISKDNEELNSKIKELQEENKKALLEGEERISKLKLDNSIELALIQAGANNNKAVKALLDLDKIKLDNDKLTGLDEQITSLKTSDGYLFKQEETKVEVPTGLTPSTSNTNDVSKTNNNFKSYDQILNEI